MVLLALCVVAIAAAGLRIVTSEPDLPAGSSHSAQADGAEALYLWAEGERASPTRVTQARAVETTTPHVLLVLEPEEGVSDRTQRAFSTVARRGGTLVLAGDSFPLSVYARELDVTLEPSAPTSTVTDGNRAGAFRSAPITACAPTTRHRCSLPPTAIGSPFRSATSGAR